MKYMFVTLHLGRVPAQRPRPRQTASGFLLALGGLPLLTPSNKGLPRWEKQGSHRSFLFSTLFKLRPLAPPLAAAAPTPTRTHRSPPGATAATAASPTDDRLLGIVGDLGGCSVRTRALRCSGEHPIPRTDGLLGSVGDLGECSVIVQVAWTPARTPCHHRRRDGAARAESAVGGQRRH